MTSDYAQTLGLGAVPADHDTSQGFGDTYNAALSQGQVAESFRSEYARVQEYLSNNREAYANRRAAAGLTAANLRVISNIGVEEVWRQYSVSEGSAPIFEWYAPRIASGVQPFQEEIKFIVNHSFGRGRDRRALARGQRTIAIDPATGHSPDRFFSGVRQMTNPDAAPSGRTATAHQGGIHHLISLKGDLVNSVPWDNSCYHGEGSAGQYPGLRVNPRSIGIQHEEWFAFPPGARHLRPIEDQGPYNESVYAVNAFILKKLEAYTNQDFKVYLGTGDIARQNIRNGVIGCFNHSATSNHDDPGAEFLLPPDYELRTTNLASIPETRDHVAAWNRRIQRWYGDLATGTQISAYYRIFNIASRIRNFNLQTEVFDPSRSTSLVISPPPSITGGYAAAAAQSVALDSLSGMDRAARLTGTSRVSMYDAAQVNAAAVTTALARQSSRLSDVAERAVTLPVIVNALGFDYFLGQWVNVTSTRRAAGVEGPDLETPAPTTDVPASTAPNTDAPTPSPNSTRIAIIGSSSASLGNALPRALQNVWGPVRALGKPGKNASNFGELPQGEDALNNFAAIVVYFPGNNGVDSGGTIRTFTQRIREAAPSVPVFWAVPPNWPISAANMDLLYTRHDATTQQAHNIRYSSVPVLDLDRPLLEESDLDSQLLHLTPSGARKVAAAWQRPRTRT